jgi:hypothetical protein
MFVLRQVLKPVVCLIAGEGGTAGFGPFILDFARKLSSIRWPSLKLWPTILLSFEGSQPKEDLMAVVGL